MKVNNFYANGYGVNLADYRIGDISQILRQRIKNSIWLSGFEMSWYNLEQLLSYCSKLSSINFSYWKLTDNEEILLDDDFENLKSLNLENIGLSKFNIEQIIDYLIFKKIHYRMNYINVFHDNMEEYMEYLKRKLIKSGYSGEFKTMTDWASFMGFLSRCGGRINAFFGAIFSFIFKILYYMAYPVIYPYRMIFGQKAN